ncbi:hypothetical protein GDO86_007242 [Hymenochirus boettgeri]|uniref:LIM and cysteine-rich domains protein 1 n=1 Tax=Hymenochirus boettgeri TaxID=247094 RepID=A0A8T2IVU0_9PIPI|nr:hypothetical protein GDO86_007242 [Hymenochirus boettgeri]
MSVGSLPTGQGASWKRCPGSCTGFHPHSWRKTCGCCQCPREEHSLPADLEEDSRIGQLLSDSRYSGLTARVKGTEGARVYKRNRMIITNPITSGKDPTFLTVTYEWAPPGLNQKLAMQYMELIPKKMRPVAGTEGAIYRRIQLLRQLPPHDQNPDLCRGLSERDRPGMQEFVKRYKEGALGVAEVALPHTIKQQTEKNGGETKATNGAEKETPGKMNYFCEFCQKPMTNDAPAIYADRAGFEKQWHPACFVCCQCREPLVNLIYFWKNSHLWCGRHYCESEKPRCAGCDEVIFSEDYHQVDGTFWHSNHFSCVGCDQTLNGKPYVLQKSQLMCEHCGKAKTAH